MVFIGMLLSFLGRSMRQLENSIRRLGSGNLADPIKIAGPSDLRHLGSTLESVRARLLELETLKQPARHDATGEAGTPLENTPTGGRTGATPSREPYSQEAEIPLPLPLADEA